MIMGVGAAFIALYDTHRGDMVAIVGEAFGEPSLKRMHDAMMACEEGRHVLLEKPRIQGSGDIAYLRGLPSNTFGNAYIRWMDLHGYDPSARSAVRYVCDKDHAYVMQRYREVHDLWHVLVGFPTSVLAEIGQKWLELLQTGLPMCFLSSVVGPLRLSTDERIQLMRFYIPWAAACHSAITRTGVPLIARYYEDYFEQDIDEVRATLGIIPFHSFVNHPAK